MKRLVAVLLAVLAAPLAFAKFHGFPHKDDPVRQWVQLAYGRSADLGFEGAQHFFSGGYNITAAPFNAFVGMQFTDGVTDLTVDGDWWSLEFFRKHGLLRFGLGLDYHVEWYDDISCEHDIIFTPQMDWQSTRHYLFTLRAGLLKKISNIYMLPGVVDNWGLVFGVSLGKQWDNGMEVRLEAGSRSLYRVPVFGTAFFTPSVAYTFKNGLRLGLEAEIMLRDWIAATYYLDSAIVRVTGRVYF